MRPEKYFLTIMVLSTLVLSTSSTSREPSVMSVFAGTTPCGRIIRPLHKIRRDVDCAMVEWKLILYRDIDGVRPTTYRLISVSRYIEETNLYSEPGTRSEVEGTWTITRGTKTPRDVTIYRLNDEMTGMSI